MSRSGYCDDCDDPASWAMWRGQVASALRGKRGQQFLRDLVAALEVLPEKKLIRGALETTDTGEGAVCALGAVRRYRKMLLDGLEQAISNEDYQKLGDRFDIAHQLAQEVMYENDERGGTIVGGVFTRMTPELRYQHMLEWAKQHIRVRPEELASLPAAEASWRMIPWVVGVVCGWHDPWF